MQKHTIIVRADWDEEAGVWVATTSDIEGLAVEAETLEKLSDKVCTAIVDLVELNGFEGAASDIPVHIMADKLLRIPADCAA
ncbi:MAG: DUF1902 domain-containing protein [Rhodobacteraceae bacterium]|nr:DUF1902 domain-containing protein [Paracoccaceae bacterium]